MKGVLSDPAKMGSPSPAFLHLLTNHQSTLYAGVVALIGYTEGAQDVLQETNAALLEKASEYDPGRPFVPWAMGFAKMQVLAWRKRQSRDRLVLDDDLFGALADRLATEPPLPNRRLDALERCLGKLPAASRELVEDRYTLGETVQGIAERLGRSVNVVSVSLFRIRQALLDCIRETLLAEEDS
jgi:RNA polymerase sigma-70 factor (ECF subfamily)